MGCIMGEGEGVQRQMGIHGAQCISTPCAWGTWLHFYLGGSAQAGGRRNPVHWILSRDLGVGGDGVQAGPSLEMDSRGCRTKQAPLI